MPLADQACPGASWATAPEQARVVVAMLAFECERHTQRRARPRSTLGGIVLIAGNRRDQCDFAKREIALAMTVPTGCA
jgi:hypothetical protein